MESSVDSVHVAVWDDLPQDGEDDRVVVLDTVLFDRLKDTRCEEPVGFAFIATDFGDVLDAFFALLLGHANVEERLFHDVEGDDSWMELSECGFELILKVIVVDQKC